MSFTPFRAVQEQHICALWTHHLHTRKILLNKTAGIGEVAVNNSDHLVCPACSLFTVGPKQGVHGEHIHIVIMCGSPFETNPVSQERIVDHMIRTYKPRQTKGFAGGIESYRPVFCIIRNRLRGDVPIAGHNNVTPDFIGDHNAVIGCIDFHRFLDFPAFPDAPAWIVRRTEDGEMNVVLTDLPIHIFIVHPPDTGIVPLQFAENHLSAEPVECASKADIRRGMHQNTLTRCRKGTDSRAYSPQHAVFISDGFLRQAGITFSFPMPADNCFIIILRRSKVAEIRHLHSLSDSVQNKRPCRKTHIGNPHRNRGKTFLYGYTFKRDLICGKRVLSMPVKNRGKIKCHSCSLLPRCLTESIKQKTEEVKRS